MKLQLIMLSQPILVSDEEINQDDHITRLITFEQSIANDEWCEDKSDNWKKIIAGIPELPSIDFSALSEEDCKKIGWVDVEKLACTYSKSRAEVSTAWTSFADGFRTAQSLNEKKFNEALIGNEKGSLDEYLLNSSLFSQEDRELVMYAIYNWQENNKQPKVFDVEVEMGMVEHSDGSFKMYADVISGRKPQPKITNNQIKITKIL